MAQRYLEQANGPEFPIYTLKVYKTGEYSVFYTV